MVKGLELARQLQAFGVTERFPAGIVWSI